MRGAKTAMIRSRMAEPGSRQRVRLFKSDALERLTVISPRTFAAIWVVALSLVAVASWGVASPATALGLVLCGAAAWSLFEYAMHRFLFHWKTDSAMLRAVIFVTHGNHHVDPQDPCRNMMPPMVSLPFGALLWGLCLVALGPAGSLLFLGFAGGYVVYDSVHYACHQLPMRGAVVRRLRNHHMRHHYARRDGNYAITGVIWDRLFGTLLSAHKGR